MPIAATASFIFVYISSIIHFAVCAFGINMRKSLLTVCFNKLANFNITYECLMLLFIVVVVIVVVCDKLSAAELGVKLPIAVEFNVMRVVCFSKIFQLDSLKLAQFSKLNWNSCSSICCFIVHLFEDARKNVFYSLQLLFYNSININCQRVALNSV